MAKIRMNSNANKVCPCLGTGAPDLLLPHLWLLWKGKCSNKGILDDVLPHAVGLLFPGLLLRDRGVGSSRAAPEVREML